MHRPWLLLASLLLVAGVLWRARRPPAAEMWCVSLITVDAVTVRTAASEAYFTSLSALVLGVGATLALALRARLDGDRFGAALALTAACLLAAATARIHAAGYLPLALSPLVVLGAAR